MGDQSAFSWHLSQCFGGDQDPNTEPPEADIVSACAFDAKGEHLAAGDQGGRVVVWETDPNPRPRSRGVTPPVEFKFFCEFQSHDPEFDCLKSVEIEERINQIKWLHRPHDARFLLSTNDKTVKLWKIYDKDFTTPVEDLGASDGIIVPRLAVVETATVARPKGIYTSAHQYHINSISPSTDGDTFLSADDLRVHVWNIHVTNETLNVVDIRPDDMDNLNEVITTATFHPQNCSEFLYGTSLGAVNICDMRTNMLCTKPARVLQYDEPVRTIFTDIISSICDAKYRPTDGRYVVTRDYMTLKVWDLAMERQPVSVIRIHEQLRGQLAQLYENDAVFDKFECDFSNDGNHVITGSYQNMFHVWNTAGTASTSLEASTHFRRRRRRPQQQQSSEIDFSKKGLHVAWHPVHNLIAVCTTNNLFIYAQQQQQQSAEGGAMVMD